MADAGIRLVVEGEKEFKSALAACDAAIKNNQKELKLLTEEFKLNETGMKDASSGFGSMADAAEILAQKGKVLADSIAQQSEKVALLDQRVADAAKEYGEHDKRTEALRAQLLDASAALTKLTTEQEKNRQAIEAAKNSTAEYDEAEKSLTAALSANDAELKNLSGEMESLKKENEKLGTSSADLEKKQSNLKKQNENLTEQNKKLTDSIEKQKKQIDTLAEAQKIATTRFGEGSKEAEDYRKRLAEATGQLDKMEQELKENQAAIQSNNQELEKGGDAGKSMHDVLGKIEELTGVKIPAGLDKMIGGMDAGAVAAGGILTVLIGIAEKMQKVYEETLEYSQEVATKSVELDLGTEQYQALEYAAALAGVEMSVFESALEKISVKAGDAVEKSKEHTAQIDEQREALSAQIAEQEQAVDAAQKYADDTAGAYEKANDTYYEMLKKFMAISSDPDLIKEGLKPYDEARKAAEATRDDAQKALEETGKSLGDLQQQFADLESEQDTSMKYWDDLGISIYDTNGKIKTSYDLLMELLDAYGELPPGIERTAAMTEIFGKTYKQLNPLIDTGTNYLKEYIDEAYRVGAVLDEGTIATFNFKENQKAAWAIIKEKVWMRAVAEAQSTGDAVTGMYAGMTEAAKGYYGYLQTVTDNGKAFGAIGEWLLREKGTVSSHISSGGIGHGGRSGRYASGTMYAPGGYSLVGERGPEIVELPRGSKVYPNGTVPAGFGGGETVYESNTYNVTIDASRVQEFEDIVRIAQSARVGMRRG